MIAVITKRCVAAIDKFKLVRVNLQFQMKNFCRNTLHTLNKASQRVREATFRRERRLMLVISLVMGCFMVCWSPFFVVS